MARKKNSKALYEVLQEYPGTMAVPDWMKPRPEPTAEPVSGDASEAGQTDPVEADETPSTLPTEDREELTTEDDQYLSDEAGEDIAELPREPDSRALEELAAEARAESAEVESDRDEEPLEPDEPAIEVPDQPTDTGPIFAPALEVREADEEAPTVADAEPEWEPPEPGEELDEDGRPTDATPEADEDIQDAEETVGLEPDQPTETDAPARQPADPLEASASLSGRTGPDEDEPEAETEPVVGAGEETVPADRTEGVDPPVVLADRPAAVGGIEGCAPDSPPLGDGDETSPAGPEAWPSTAPWRAQPPDEQVLLRLRIVPAMLLLGCVGVLLVAAFVIGRVTAPPAAVPSGGEASDGNALAGTGTPPPPLNLSPAHKPDPPVATTSGQRDPGRYYLIIESLKGKSQDDFREAERILDFCRSRDIPADMVLMGDRLAIWSLLGFRSDTSPEALRHARQVEDIGKEYFKEHRTYKFLQRKSENGPFNPYFYSGRSESR